MLVRVLALLAVLATPALAATDLEVFEKSVHKYAPAPTAPLGLKKSPCVCQSGGLNHGKAGVLVHAFNSVSSGTVQVQVGCAVVTFDAATEALTTSLLCTTFEVLSK